MQKNDNVKYVTEKATDEMLESDYSSKSKLPKPPQKGELMICQFCCHPIYPNELSKDKDIRKRELKWHYHNKCLNGAAFQADYQTSDIWKERYGGKEESFYTMVAKALKKVNDEKKNKK